MAIEIRGLCPLLQVFDVQRSIDFYRDVLGFAVARKSDGPSELWWALLDRDGAELMLNSAYESNERPPAPDPARVAAHCDAALYFGCPDLDAAYADLKARGIDAKAPFVQPYGMKQLYLNDPDGYQLCLQWPAAVTQD